MCVLAVLSNYCSLARGRPTTAGTLGFPADACFVNLSSAFFCSDPRRRHFERPVLYLEDDGEELQFQHEWDQREMLQTQQARRRAAYARTRAELEAWGCETDAAGAVIPSGGRSEDSAMGVGGTLAGEAQMVPTTPVPDEDWQV